MAIDGVTQTTLARQTAPIQATDHGFGALVRKLTPAAGQIPPGLDRKLDAGQDVRNWKLAGGPDQADGSAEAGAAAKARHGGQAVDADRADATAGGRGHPKPDRIVLSA